MRSKIPASLEKIKSCGDFLVGGGYDWVQKFLSCYFISLMMKDKIETLSKMKYHFGS